MGENNTQDSESMASSGSPCSGWLGGNDPPRWMRVFGTPYSLLRVAWMAGTQIVGFLVGYYVL